jgi:glycosyltransferase involved in cell wall biosynthesis
MPAGAKWRGETVMRRLHESTNAGLATALQRVSGVDNFAGCAPSAAPRYLVNTMQTQPEDAVAEPGASDSVRLTVVMPCLNEANSLEICITKARESMRQLGVPGEVVIADNGSTDGSQEIGRAAGARVIHVEARGYGSALMAGIAAARGEFVIMGDADDSYDFSDLGPMVRELEAGHDLVLGNRFQGGIAEGAMPILHQRLGNPALTRIARWVFKSPAGDIYCGLRGFRKDAVTDLNLRSTGMEFALEMVVKATLSGLRITEVPTTLSPDRRDRAPHLRTWRDGWRSLRFFLLYSPRWLFLYPGLALMAIGLALGVALLPGPLTIGRVSFDAHTLLYASAAVVIGYQSVVFSAFARYFAVTEGLLPDKDLLTKGFRYATLEVGLAVGAALMLAGLVVSGFAVGVWESRSLGQLDYQDTLRIVIPGVTLLILGSQTIFSSFFLSILGLKRR